MIPFYARIFKQRDEQNQKADTGAAWYLSRKPQIVLHIFHRSKEKEN